MRALLPAIACITFMSVGTSRAASWDSVVNGLLAKFDPFDVLALGEWHGSEQDSALRLRLIRHPDFPRKVRYVVIETGNARHQPVLDRFIRGEDVRPEEIRKVWRDITTPGGADAPMYEAFLNEIRRLNLALPASIKLRVLAADPPIDWSSITSRSQWRDIAARRDTFAADLIERNVIGKGEKGPPDLWFWPWQRNQVIKQPNLATLLKQRYPGRLYTVSRIDPAGEPTHKFNTVIGAAALPVLLPLSDHPAGALSPNDVLGLPIRMFADDVQLRDVIDAAIYTGRKNATANPLSGASTGADPEYEAEKLRRRNLLQPR